MKNVSYWRETKIVKNKRGEYRINPYYGIGSFLVSQLVIDRFSSFLKSSKHPESVLDVGCGFMPHYVFFRENLSIDKYVGIDWVNSPHTSTCVDLLMNLNEPLELNGVYDFVLLMDVLEHLSNVSTVLVSVKEHLSENGKIFITVPFYYWIHEAPFDFNRYTIYQLKSMFNLPTCSLPLDSYCAASMSCTFTGSYFF